MMDKKMTQPIEQFPDLCLPIFEFAKMQGLRSERKVVTLQRSSVLMPSTAVVVVQRLESVGLEILVVRITTMR